MIQKKLKKKMMHNKVQNGNRGYATHKVSKQKKTNV